MKAYQKDTNSIWYTKSELVCDKCWIKTNRVMDLKWYWLFCYKENWCYFEAINNFLPEAKKQYIEVRLIINDSLWHKEL